MNKLKNILVGVDFTDRSHSALRHAVRLARWNGARLHAFHGKQIDITSDMVPKGISPAEMRQCLVDLAHEELSNWLRTVEAPPETVMHVGVGPRVDTMLEAARDTAADLILLGAADPPGAPPRAGTFSSAILRNAPTKVMLVRPQHAEPFSKVVACVDFTNVCREVVRQAIHVAERDKSEVHFLHVFHSPWQRWLHHPQIAKLMPEPLEDELSGGLLARLRDFVQVPDKVSAQIHVREAESHGRGIIAYAEDIGADLVILGSRRPDDPEFALRGSTIETVLRALPCSVLAIRPAGPSSGAGSA
jgi:nucleotide-binding universal stress UspA family protein